VAQKSLMVKFLSSKDQLTDVLTKPLVSNQFAYLRTNLNVCSQTLGLRGNIRSPTQTETRHPAVTEDNRKDLVSVCNQVRDSMR